MMLLDVPASLGVRLRRALAAGVRQAAGTGAPVLVSVTERIPAVDAVAAFGSAAEPVRALLAQPDRGFALLGTGEAVTLTGRGASRFRSVARAWRDLTARCLHDGDPGCPVAPPVGLGGFAFGARSGAAPQWAPFGGARLTVPRRLVVARGGDAWLVLSALAGPETDPEAAAEALETGRAAGGPEPAPAPAASPEGAGCRPGWEERARAVIQEIRAGAAEKVVLAREVPGGPGRPDPAAALERLRARYGGCTVFAFGVGDACFLGATPERLVRADGRHVRAMALAGSAPRGATEAEDRTLGARLLADPKERREHHLVVRALAEALAACCRLEPVPEAPGLLRLPNVQHLCTPFQGTLRGRSGLLSLVARLHPTPAVGGVPRERALALIGATERFDRGWYAGPVGWIDRAGSGEFVVAIRSALVQGGQARLYAGCGLVADSDPAREFEESELKLAPMRWALYGTEA
ncbi:MAG TPA: isochorismate synthase [Dehalococcoidia bacterium]